MLETNFNNTADQRPLRNMGGHDNQFNIIARGTVIFRQRSGSPDEPEAQPLPGVPSTSQPSAPRTRSVTARGATPAGGVTDAPPEELVTTRTWTFGPISVRTRTARAIPTRTRRIAVPGAAGAGPSVLRARRARGRARSESPARTRRRDTRDSINAAIGDITERASAGPMAVVGHGAASSEILDPSVDTNRFPQSSVSTAEASRTQPTGVEYVAGPPATETVPKTSEQREATTAKELDNDAAFAEVSQQEEEVTKVSSYEKVKSPPLSVRFSPDKEPYDAGAVPKISQRRKSIVAGNLDSEGLLAEVPQQETVTGVSSYESTKNGIGAKFSPDSGPPGAATAPKISERRHTIAAEDLDFLATEPQQIEEVTGVASYEIKDGIGISVAASSSSTSKTVTPQHGSSISQSPSISAASSATSIPPGTTSLIEVFQPKKASYNSPESEVSRSSHYGAAAGNNLGLTDTGHVIRPYLPATLTQDVKPDPRPDDLVATTKPTEAGQITSSDGIRHAQEQPLTPSDHELEIEVSLTGIEGHDWLGGKTPTISSTDETSDSSIDVTVQQESDDEQTPVLTQTKSHGEHSVSNVALCGSFVAADHSGSDVSPASSGVPQIPAILVELPEQRTSQEQLAPDISDVSAFHRTSSGIPPVPVSLLELDEKPPSKDQISSRDVRLSQSSNRPPSQTYEVLHEIPWREGSGAEMSIDDVQSTTGQLHDVSVDGGNLNEAPQRDASSHDVNKCKIDSSDGLQRFGSASTQTSIHSMRDQAVQKAETSQTEASQTSFHTFDESQDVSTVCVASHKYSNISKSTRGINESINQVDPMKISESISEELPHTERSVQKIVWKEQVEEIKPSGPASRTTSEMIRGVSSSEIPRPGRILANAPARPTPIQSRRESTSDGFIQESNVDNVYPHSETTSDSRRDDTKSTTTTESVQIFKPIEGSQEGTDAPGCKLRTWSSSNSQLPQQGATKRSDTPRHIRITSVPVYISEEDGYVAPLSYPESAETTAAEKEGGFRNVLRQIFSRASYSPDYWKKELAEVFSLCNARSANATIAHSLRKWGERRLHRLVHNAPAGVLYTLNEKQLIWSALGVLLHHQIRLTSETGFEWLRRLHARRAERFYGRLISKRPSLPVRPVVPAVLSFLHENEAWSMEHLCVEVCGQVLTAGASGSLLVHGLLDYMELMLDRNAEAARCIVRTIYGLLDNAYWAEHPSEATDCYRRMLWLYWQAVQAHDELEVLRAGLDVCVRRLVRNVDGAGLRDMLAQMARWVLEEQLTEDSLLEFGSVMEFTACTHEVQLYDTSIGPELFTLILEMIASDRLVTSLIGNRVMHYLVDRRNNHQQFDSPKIFFENMNYDIVVGEYWSDDKRFLKIHRQKTHDSLMRAFTLHGEERANLDGTYRTICLLATEVPCGYTAAAVVCIVMNLQDHALRVHTESLHGFYLHATVMAIMSLICWLHHATDFYVYVNKVMARRADKAPHLNPPLMVHYTPAQHHILWNKPDLFFTDWDVRYGLWKCFRVSEGRKSAVYE